MSENMNEENVQKPHCIVLGTYYGTVIHELLKPGYSGESKNSKNSILWSKLEELNLRDQAILIFKKEIQ